MLRAINAAVMAIALETRNASAMSLIIYRQIQYTTPRIVQVIMNLSIVCRSAIWVEADSVLESRKRQDFISMLAISFALIGARSIKAQVQYTTP